MIYRVIGMDEATNTERQLLISAQDERNAIELARRQGVHSFFVDRDVHPPAFLFHSRPFVALRG